VIIREIIRTIVIIREIIRTIECIEGNLKMCPLIAVAFYIEIQNVCIYSMNGENEIVLYRQ